MRDKYQLKSGTHTRGSGEVLPAGSIFTPTRGELRHMGDRLVLVERAVREEPTPDPESKSEPQKPTVSRAKPTGEYPKHKGGGYYILSDGTQVRGQSEALAREEELNNGESSDGE